MQDHPDPLRPDRCPECGYSRQGLPEEALCPECGFAYSPDLVVVYGQGNPLATTAQGGLARVWRTLGSPWMTPVWMSFALFGPHVQKLLPRLLNPGLFVGLFCASVAIYYRWRLRRDELQDRWQLRLSAAGFAQREFLGPVALHPWGVGVQVEVKAERRRPRGLFRPRHWPADNQWVTIRVAPEGAAAGASRMLAYLAFGGDAATAERLREKIEQWQAAARPGRNDPLEQ